MDGGNLQANFLTNRGSLSVDGGVASVVFATNVAGGRMIVRRDLSVAQTFTNAQGGRIELAGGTGRVVGAAPDRYVQNNGLLTGDGAVLNGVSNNATGEIRAEAGKSLALSGAVLPNAGLINLQGGRSRWRSPWATARRAGSPGAAPCTSPRASPMPARCSSPRGSPTSTAPSPSRPRGR